MLKKILFAAAMTAALVANGALPSPVSAQAPAFQPTRFSVVVEGSGPDLILIPGLTSSRHVWDQAVASLGGHSVSTASRSPASAASRREATRRGPCSRRWSKRFMPILRPTICGGR